MPTHPERVGILPWIFLRGRKAITCEIRVDGSASYDVCLLPHWDLSSALIERYDGPASALYRHAEIAQAFRDAGWTLICAGSDHASAAT